MGGVENEKKRRVGDGSLTVLKGHFEASASGNVRSGMERPSV